MARWSNLLKNQHSYGSTWYQYFRVRKNNSMINACTNCVPGDCNRLYSRVTRHLVVGYLLEYIYIMPYPVPVLLVPIEQVPFVNEGNRVKRKNKTGVYSFERFFSTTNFIAVEYAQNTYFHSCSRACITTGGQKPIQTIITSRTTCIHLLQSTVRQNVCCHRNYANCTITQEYKTNGIQQCRLHSTV